MDYGAKFQFFQQILGKGQYSSKNKEALFSCFACHHHKPKLAVNIEEDLYQCWVCGQKGNLIGLLKKIGTQQDLQQYFDKFKAKNVKILKKSDEIDTFRVNLPEECVPLVDYKNHILGRKYYDYLLNKRGITEIDILRYKIGVAFDGEYKEKIILPSFDKRGLINFYTARDWEGRYWQPTVPKGYKYSVILNELNLDFKKPLVIVEGFFDMLKSVPNTVPLFGSTLPIDSLLFHTIIENNTEVFMALDPDAEEKCNRIIDNLLKYDIMVSKVNIKPFKDLGEMTKKEFFSRFQETSCVTKNDILRDRIRNI